MAERSVHEAAVEAMAGLIHADLHHTADGLCRLARMCRCSEPEWCARTASKAVSCPGPDSEAMERAERYVAALVASAEVRDAMVPCLRWGDSGLPCDYRAGTPTNHPELGTTVHPECFLAALAGTEVAESSD